MAGITRVALFGAGGHGKVVLDAVLAGNGCHVVAVLDEDPAKAGQSLLGVPIVTPARSLAELAGRLGFQGVVLAIGDNYVRDRKLHEVQEAGLKPVSVIHPSAQVSRFTELGEGVVILAGAVINAGSALEDNVCINTAASVDHDTWLGCNSHIFPHATLTGGVRVGEFAYVGSGAVVNPYLSIGRYSYVGSGAVVVRDVPEGVTVAGVPAREISRQLKRPESPAAVRSSDSGGACRTHETGEVRK